MSGYHLRWAQLDVARQMETVEFIEQFISLLADSGFNGLLLYLEDRIKTPGYQLAADNEVYTVDEIRHLVEYASARGVEIVPCVATLGHAERFLRHEKLSHLAELQGNMTGRFGGTKKQTFCVTNPDFYPFIESYLREVASLFPSRWFHIGLDEFWDFNLCERCRKAMPTLPDEWKIFLNHIGKIRKILAGCGKRIMMWSDMFEYYPEAFKDVPKDVVMVDWQYQPDVRKYLGHLLDVDCEDRLAINAACGFETIVAPADLLLWNSQSYFEYAKGRKGVLGGLLTSWEKNDTFLYRTLPVFVSGGLQMNGLSPDDAFDAMTVKLFGTDDTVFRAALKTALNSGLLRHFERLTEAALCTRDYRGLDIHSATGCAGNIAILKSSRDKVTTELGLRCLDDLIDALREKAFSDRGKFLAHEIFDKSCTPERRRAFTAFRKEFEEYLDHMIGRWKSWRSSITPNVFAEKKDELLRALSDFEDRLASNAWIGITCTLPDIFGVEKILIEYKTGGKWHSLPATVCKPDQQAIFCRFFPLSADFSEKVENVRLTASGMGGIGINFVEIHSGGKHYVPRAILRVSGNVSDPGFLLDNNTTFAWFGGQSTRNDYFDRNAAEQRHSVLLEMREYSPDAPAMARFE